MTLVSGARSAGQRERCGQKNCKTPALSVVVHMCRYVDVLHTHTCAVTECSFVCTFGSSYRVPETNCVHPFIITVFPTPFKLCHSVSDQYFLMSFLLCEEKVGKTSQGWRTKHRETPCKRNSASDAGLIWFFRAMHVGPCFIFESHHFTHSSRLRKEVPDVVCSC